MNFPQILFLSFVNRLPNLSPHNHLLDAPTNAPECLTKREASSLHTFVLFQTISLIDTSGVLVYNIGSQAITIFCDRRIIMNDSPKLSPLPLHTAQYITDPQKMSEAAVRGMISNPIYAGVPPYHRVVSDEVWVRSAVQLIQEEGAEQFLVNMLYMLRNSMVDAVPDEAIPPDYNGPWPHDEDEDFSLASQDPSLPPSPWHHPMEGFVFCSHDGSPMIAFDGEFVCISEYLYAHLGDSCVTDLITQPVLTLVFQNGHTLPLLCPDCDQTLHIDDHNDLLEGLNGLIIVDITWDHETEELILEFGPPDNPDFETEPSEALFVHLDSVRELTCPHKETWPDD
jgi:hypothetical protein